jgi:hypothetical protein
MAVRGHAHAWGTSLLKSIRRSQFYMCQQLFFQISSKSVSDIKNKEASQLTKKAFELFRFLTDGDKHE